MSAFEENYSLSAVKSCMQVLGMMAGDQGVRLAMDEANLFGLRHLFKSSCDFHLLDRQTCQMVDFGLDACEHTGEEAMEEAAAGFRQKFRAGFLAKRRKVGVSRVCDHDIAFIAHKQTNCAHASTPTYYNIPLFLQKQSSNIYVFALLLSQRNEALLIPQSTSAEIKASQCNSIWQRGQKQRSLKPTRPVSVKIQHDILGLLLGVKCQLEWNLKVLNRETMCYSFARFEYIWIVVEPGGTNEHVGQLLNDAVGLITLHLVGKRTKSGSTLISLRLFRVGLFGSRLHLMQFSYIQI